MIAKVIIVIMLLLIVGSLFSALFFLAKDRGQNDRTVKALTLRVSLSVALFAMLMIAYYFDLITPTGLYR